MGQCVAETGGRKVWPAVRNLFKSFTSRLEGTIPWMYVDRMGLVTTAIGNLIDPVEYALDLPWMVAKGRTPATKDQIRAEWERVKADKDGLRYKGGWHGGPTATLVLSDDAINSLVYTKLAANEAQLRREFPEWDTWPADAQLATLSVAWANGADLVDSGWPKLVAALRAQDWDTAAAECHISETNNPGVAPRNVQNRTLYLNAARSAAANVAADVLCGPYVEM